MISDTSCEHSSGTLYRNTRVVCHSSGLRKSRKNLGASLGRIRAVNEKGDAEVVNIWTSGCRCRTNEAAEAEQCMERHQQKTLCMRSNSLATDLTSRRPPRTGCSPVTISHSTMPKLKMSAFSVHFSLVSTSGAAHANVPAAVHVWHHCQDPTCIVRQPSWQASRQLLPSAAATP